MDNYAFVDLEALRNIYSVLRESQQRLPELSTKVKQYFSNIDYQLAQTVKSKLENIDRLENEVRNVPEDSRNSDAYAAKRKKLSDATENLIEIRQMIARYEDEKLQLCKVIYELGGDVADSGQRGMGALSASIAALENYLQANLNPDTKKTLAGNNQKIETQAETRVKERFRQLGVTDVNLSGVHDSYQEKIVSAFEEMYVKYPQLNGYINSVGIDDLGGQAIACAGPLMSLNGFMAQVLFDKDRFTSSGLESYLKRMSKENFAGERWLAGNGIESIVKHEIAHILHLEANAHSNGIGIGSDDITGYTSTLNDYMQNDIINRICADSLYELGLGNIDIPKQLSRYAGQDFGECFAEAMSEMETSDSPRALAQTIAKRYNEYIVNGRTFQ